MTESQMKTFQELVERVVNALRGRYVHALEEESARLRAENRALLNSLLGTWPQIAQSLESTAAKKKTFPA
jgi:maltooligosyltrehalose synthase